MNKQKDTHKTKQLTSEQFLAESYLKEIGFQSVPFKKNTVLVMEKEYIINTVSVPILIVIEEIFPIKYPKFYIKNDSIFLMYPHIEQKNKEFNAHSICLYKEEDKLYYKNTDFLLQDNINRLEKFIKELNNGNLKSSEIFDEFDSYWVSTSSIIHFNKTLIDDIESFSLLDIYQSNSENKLILIDEQQKVRNYFDKQKITYSKNKIIYMNFKNNFPSKIPATYKEFLEIIDNSGYINELNTLKKVEDLFDGILFSFYLPNGNKHYAFFSIMPAGRKDGKKTKKMNPILDICNPLRTYRKIIGGKAKDISNKRLYTRGGNEINNEVNEKNKKIAIIGCGSIGASLSYKLIKSGCNNLLLIDPDILTVDNIARHLLGMEYVNSLKTESLNKYLSKQFIDIEIDSIPKNAEYCYNELKKCDLIISAVGSEGKVIETKLIEDAVNGILPPVISCWIEANAIAGHSILFNENCLITKNNITNIIDDVFSDICILKSTYAQSLEKEDVGCNSNYMPYSFLNADIHTNHFTNMIIQYLLNNSTEQILTSIGDVKKEDNLKDKYKGITPHMLIKKELTYEKV